MKKFSLLAFTAFLFTAHGFGQTTINYFYANPNNINAGSSSTLTWSTSNATSATILPGIGAVPVNGSISTGAICDTTVFTLSAFGNNGNPTATVTVVIHGTCTNGVDEIVGMPVVTMTPNPAHDVVSITSSDKLGDISIFNLLGEELFHLHSGFAKELKINVSFLPQGIYFVRGENFMQQFTKQ